MFTDPITTKKWRYIITVSWPNMSWSFQEVLLPSCQWEIHIYKINSLGKPITQWNNSEKEYIALFQGRKDNVKPIIYFLSYSSQSIFQMLSLCSPQKKCVS